MCADVFSCPVSRQIWESKYRYRDGARIHDADIADSWQRVAQAVAAVEQDPDQWAERFQALLAGFRFLPGGRILAGAGTGRSVTLANCFVMGLIEDSIDGIFDALKEGAVTMQQGGGIGYDFSTLRPAGTFARAVGNIASGPVSFMRIWDIMCATILSTGARRGAMMACLRCDHPDIERFIDAKSDPAALRHFNLSVLVSDAFMDAVERDDEWPLVFPASRLDTPTAAGSCVDRSWPGFDGPIPCRITKVVPARVLWRRLTRAAFDCAEPGVLFIDRINRSNPLSYRETVFATNPCGEVPLPPYGACNLGSLNLARFVCEPFSAAARVDFDALDAASGLAVRFLDDVIDVSGYPLTAQRDRAQQSRRVGLGVTGLADALCMLGLGYDSQAARVQAADIMRVISRAAYRASIELAREKGSFPQFDGALHAGGEFLASMPPDIVEGLQTAGLRNSHLLAIAPTGSISLLANNVSSGIEPVFGLTARRRILQQDGEYATHAVEDYAWARWRDAHPDAPPPAFFTTARDITPRGQLAMQAAVQPFVDQAISKTVSVAEDFPSEEFQELYRQAYRLGLKGCTSYRPNPVTGAILSTPDDRHGAAIHCCDIEREAD
jgi:ribonucleoside-diphosphate reductase alpha chain